MKIEIASVITRTKRRLGIMDTTRWDAELESLINEAAFNLDAVNSFVISCETIDVECAKAKLPDNATEVIAIRTTDTTQCSGLCRVVEDEFSVDDRFMECGCACGNYFVANRNVLTNFDGNGCYGGNIFSTQNGYISFPSNTTLTSVKVWYRGTNQDEDGIMILDERQQRGFSAYAAWQFASSGTHYNKYQPRQISGWEREWVAQRGRLVGIAQQDDFRQNKGKFAAIARAILIDPYQVLNNNL